MRDFSELRIRRVEKVASKVRSVTVARRGTFVNSDVSSLDRIDSILILPRLRYRKELIRDACICNGSASICYPRD